MPISCTLSIDDDECPRITVCYLFIPHVLACAVYLWLAFNCVRSRCGVRTACDV